MECPNCQHQMIESRNGWLCLNCGHIETNAHTKPLVAEQAAPSGDVADTTKPGKKAGPEETGKLPVGAARSVVEPKASNPETKVAADDQSAGGEKPVAEVKPEMKVADAAVGSVDAKTAAGDTSTSSGGSPVGQPETEGAGGAAVDETTTDDDLGSATETTVGAGAEVARPEAGESANLEAASDQAEAHEAETGGGLADESAKDQAMAVVAEAVAEVAQTSEPMPEQVDDSAAKGELSVPASTTSLPPKPAAVHASEIHGPMMATKSVDAIGPKPKIAAGAARVSGADLAAASTGAASEIGAKPAGAEGVAGGLTPAPEAPSTPPVGPVAPMPASASAGGAAVPAMAPSRAVVQAVVSQQAPASQPSAKPPVTPATHPEAMRPIEVVSIVLGVILLVALGYLGYLLLTHQKLLF